MSQENAAGGSAESSKVHFSENQDHSEITVCRESESRIVVHLGFLQIRHHYEVKFSVEDDLYEDLEFDPLQSLYCKIQEIMPSENGEGHDFVVALLAHKEKLVKEELKVKEPEGRGQGRGYTLVLKARVLGKGMGTPSLKSGIRLVGIEVDEDSEQSDWSGFQ